MTSPGRRLRVITLYEQGVTIEPALARIGAGREFGDLATHGHAESAVLKVLRSSANGSGPPPPPEDEFPVQAGEKLRSPS